MTLTIIAAITRDRALGNGGDMIYHISADLKRFKALTMGYPIVMGRRTFESFPNGPLPGRENIVLTRDADYSHPGITIAHDWTSLLAGEKYGLNADKVFVLGGGQIYKQAMQLADRLEITEIDADAGDADTYFPEIDASEWKVVAMGEWLTDPRSGVRFRYVTYERV